MAFTTFAAMDTLHNTKATVNIAIKQFLSIVRHHSGAIAIVGKQGL